MFYGLRFGWFKLEDCYFYFRKGYFGKNCFVERWSNVFYGGWIVGSEGVIIFFGVV